MSPHLSTGKLLVAAVISTAGLFFHVRLLAAAGDGPDVSYDDLPYWELKNAKGMRVVMSSVGATVTNLFVPDKDGNEADVVLGYDTQSEYVNNNPCTYFGATIGRVANRVSNAQFDLDGKTYKLYANDGNNTLHGGRIGFNKRVFKARRVQGKGYQGVSFTYTSPDGEEGFPGRLQLTVTYKLANKRNDLEWNVGAKTSSNTIVNIVLHHYFNLAGHNNGTALDHILRLPGATHYTPSDPDTLIPTGEILPVNGTPFDFDSAEHAVGERIGEVAGGYDHNWVLHGMGTQAKDMVGNNGSATTKPQLAAVVKDPKSGRRMEIYTTAPGMQLYTANSLDGTTKGKNGTAYIKHASLSLETQAFPNSINTPNFPSVILAPQVKYRHISVYKFYAD